MHKQTEEQALALLLTHLPLLHLGNSDARKEYMKLLPKVLLSSSKTQRYFDQCRQLLSLALVHPAFPPEDKKALNFWLEKLDGKHKPDAVAPTQQPPVAVVVVPSPRKIVSLPPSSTPSIASATPPSSSSSSSTASPHKKVHQIRSEESSSGLGNDDLLIDGYIGPVSNGFESDAPTLTSLSPQPPSFHSSPNYVTPLEDMDKRVTLPPNLTAHDVLQMGKMLNSRSTTLPARTVGFGPADDMTAIDWNHGMKGKAPTHHICLASVHLHENSLFSVSFFFVPSGEQAAFMTQQSKWLIYYFNLGRAVTCSTTLSSTAKPHSRMWCMNYVLAFGMCSEHFHHI